MHFAAAVLFILGLKAHVLAEDARSGIVWAGVGMALATLVTFLTPGLAELPADPVAIGVGSAAAWVSGKKVAMTDMPQMSRSTTAWAAVQPASPGRAAQGWRLRCRTARCSACSVR